MNSDRKCSTDTVLDDNTFSYNSRSHTITILYIISNALEIAWSPDSDNVGDLDGLKLVVDGTSFDFAMADTRRIGDRGWSNSGLTWADGASISVKLIDPTGPAAITDLAATPGSAQVALSWGLPADNGEALTKFQYRSKAGSNAYIAWTDIPSSTATTTSHTVAGLTDNTEYRFEVRAVNGAGAAEASNEVVATPPNYGAGALTIKPEGGGSVGTGLSLTMAAAGVRGGALRAPQAGGLSLAVKGDVRVTRVSSDAATDALAGRLLAANVGVWRVRAGIEGRRSFALDAKGSVVTPGFEVNLDVVRNEVDGEAPEHAVMLRGGVRF